MEVDATKSCEEGVDLIRKEAHMPKHLIWSKILPKKEYDLVLVRAEQFVREGISPDIARGKIVATLFFQPPPHHDGLSNRHASPVVVGWRDGNTDSMEKGEDLEDHSHVFWVCCIALRHLTIILLILPRASRVPVINGGSGSKEHGVGALMLRI